MKKIVSINPEIQGGTPCIAGTRIPVAEVVYLHYKRKFSPEEIATKHFLSLSVFQIKKALQWYKTKGGK